MIPATPNAVTRQVNRCIITEGWARRFRASTQRTMDECPPDVDPVIWAASINANAVTAAELEEEAKGLRP